MRGSVSLLRRLVRREGVDAARRHVAMRLDQGAALIRHRLDPPRRVGSSVPSRLALISVNFSTTRYLKLMLLTLCEQQRLGLVQHVVVVDNGSRDGGLGFLRQLQAAVPRLHLVEHRHLLNHARGLRAGIRHLDRVDADRSNAADLVVFCDPDVVFRDPETLAALATAGRDGRATLIGELRPRSGAEPSIQASFLAVGRDVLARRDVRPPVYHGSPTYWMQRDIWRAGLPVVDFASNHGGYILHRGRTAVAATPIYRPRHPYGSVRRSAPHYMGVPGGAHVWAEIEARFAALLSPGDESRLIDHLASRLGALGTDALGTE